MRFLDPSLITPQPSPDTERFPSMVKRLTATACALLLSLAVSAQAPTSAEQDRPFPNAAALYRKAIEELQQALPHPEHEAEIAIPDDLPDGSEDYGGKQWREAVSKGAVAIMLFAQASQIPTCVFDKAMPQLETEFGNSAARIFALQRLTAARGWQLASGDPGGALVLASQLLQHAEHCTQQQNLMGLFVGFAAEQRAAALLQVACKHLAGHVEQRALATQFLNKLDQHLAARPTRVLLANILEQEFAWTLKEGLDEALRNAATQAASQRAIEMYREIVSPLRKDATVTAEALAEHAKQRLKQLRKLVDTRQLTTVLRDGRGEVLAAAMTLLLSVDPSRSLKESLDRAKLLDEQRRELSRLAGN